MKHFATFIEAEKAGFISRAKVRKLLSKCYVITDITNHVDRYYVANREFLISKIDKQKISTCPIVISTEEIILTKQAIFGRFECRVRLFNHQHVLSVIDQFSKEEKTL